jgi:hypothetical protein
MLHITMHGAPIAFIALPERLPDSFPHLTIPPLHDYLFSHKNPSAEGFLSSQKFGEIEVVGGAKRRQQPHIIQPVRLSKAGVGGAVTAADGTTAGLDRVVIGQADSTRRVIESENGRAA